MGQSDEAIYEQYQALYKKYDDRTLGDTIDEGLTNEQKRQKYSRKLESTDLDLIIQEEALRGNTIPPEKAQEYVDLVNETRFCLLYTSPSPRDKRQSRMPSSA